MGLKYDCWVNFSQNPFCYTFLKKRTFFEFCVVASLEKQFEGSTESGFRFRQNAAQIVQYIFYIYQNSKVLAPVVFFAELI